MNKPSSLIWMVFILLIIVPTPAGKLLVDLAGSIFLLLVFIILTIGGTLWFSWKRIQSKMQTCEACGSTFINSQLNCPVCGTSIKNTSDIMENIPASAATIDIKSEDLD